MGPPLSLNAADSVSNQHILPDTWREELAARRQVLAARPDERGHLLAAEPPVWSQKPGPVPERPHAAQQRRDTTRQIELFRGCYVSKTPEKTTLAYSSMKAVTVSKRGYRPATG